MPIFDYRCKTCGTVSEFLMQTSDKIPSCPSCGSQDMEKLMGAHASISGPRSHTLPGPSDTGCCGSSPGHAQCAGPGSCCGKA